MSQLKKNESIFFTLQTVTKLSEIWVWDPGSGKNLSRIRILGSKKHQNPGYSCVTLK